MLNRSEKVIKAVLSRVSKIFRRVLPQNIFDKLEYRANCIVFSEFRANCMRKATYGGLNADKTFYVCRIDNPQIGILSAYLVWLDEMQEVEKNGYIPVFDLKNNYLPLVQDKENAHHENAWDYYFDSSNCYSDIEKVYQSKNVVLGWKNWSKPNHVDWMTHILNEDEIRKFNRLAVKYMDFSPEIKVRAELVLNRIPAGKKVLGIALRAGYLWGELLGLPHCLGHPKQKTLGETIELAQNMMLCWQCDYVFVSVEDREWLENFKEVFGEKCIWVERELIHLFENGKPVVDKERKQIELKNVTKRKKTVDYLTEVYILSCCDDLFGGLSSGMTVAQILNNCHYEHINIYNEGVIK